MKHEARARSYLAKAMELCDELDAKEKERNFGGLRFETMEMIDVLDKLVKDEKEKLERVKKEKELQTEEEQGQAHYPRVAMVSQPLEKLKEVIRKRLEMTDKEVPDASNDAINMMGDLTLS